MAWPLSHDRPLWLLIGRRMVLFCPVTCTEIASRRVA